MMDATMELHERQLEEIEALRSIFPNEGEFVLEQAHTTGDYAVGTDNEGPANSSTNCAGGCSFSVNILEILLEDSCPQVHIRFPANYPEQPLSARVVCSSLSHSELLPINELVKRIAQDEVGCEAALTVILEVKSWFEGRLQDQELQLRSKVSSGASGSFAVRTTVSPGPIGSSPLPTSKVASPTLLGRRAIYSHHIINPNKRRVVREWALEGRLGGYSKIGWPGVIIVEGEEENVKRYVSSLSRLRWKHFVVRGEEIVQVPEGETLDSMRKLPTTFTEFGEDGMSELARHCREHDVEGLFLTVMKIYSRPDDASKKK